MMPTVPQVTSGLGLRKFQVDGFLLTRVYKMAGKTKYLNILVLYSTVSRKQILR